ncbi:synaptotagmin-6-like [Acropora millepora]|uniref:synaptotagmin-6-like n=1 Tax=Acropora millepora TaxID=45264 RepID=UPI001CF15518|nr:synaptotagmin-6-like [Acropora millepora]
MGTGASTASRRQWTAVDEDNSTVEDARPRTAANANLPANDISGMSKLVEAKNRFMKIKNKEKNTACFQKQLDGTDIIKELYKRMDPTVTQPDSGDIRGDVQLSLKYNHRQQLLLVKVIRARDLVARDLNGKSDPYAVLDLVPDVQNEGKKKTAYKAKTLNPVFNEIVSFQLEQSCIAETKLRVAIWDHDFFGEDDFNGEGIVDLSKISLNSGTYTDWFMLQLETDFSIKGELEVSLEYQEPESLFVTVHKAYNIKAGNTLRNTSDAFVKVAVSGINFHQETKVVSGSLDPEFEETFEFQVPQEEFASRVVLFHLLDKELVGSNSSLGQVHIELKNLDLDEPIRMCFPLADLKNESYKRSEWAQSAVAQEFREAMYAHALYRHPLFLRSMETKGRKMYSLSSRSAGSSAKVFLVNGIPG